MDVEKQIEEIGVVPVITLAEAEQAVPLAKALVAGDVPVAEVTFRSQAAAAGIKRIADEVPAMLVGAGTVLTIEQADAAIGAGAQFIVTPGFSPAIVDHCQAAGIPVFPGVSSPTEIEAALAKGLSVLKFFPAEALGGIAMLKALAGPYRNVRFMPTGGVNLGNLLDYLALPQVVACGGSWLAPKDALAAGDYTAITKIARSTVRRIVGFTVDDRVVEIEPPSSARATAYLARKGTELDSSRVRLV